AQETIIQQMRTDIKTTVVRGYAANRPGAFKVSYEGANRQVVAEVANQLSNFYVDENLKARETQAEGTTEFLKSQLDQAKKTLDELEAAVSRYKQSHNGELPQQEGAITGIVNRLQAQLQANQDALNRAHQTQSTLEGSLQAAQATEEAMTRLQQMAASAQVATSGSSDSSSSAPVLPTPPGKRKQSEVLEDQLALMLERYREDHPEVRQARAAIARIKQMEEREEKNAAQWAALQAAAQSGKAAGPLAPLVPGDTTHRGLQQERDKIASLKSQLNAMHKEEEFRQQEHERILKELKDTQARLQGLPIREQEMAGLTRDYEAAKANYKGLLDKYFVSDMSTEMERRQKAERFAVLDPAHVPGAPIKPDRPLFTLVGVLLASGLSVVVGIGREIKKGRVLGEWELPAGVPVLGRVPNVQTDSGEEGGPKRPKPGRKARLALVSSAVLSLAVATLYMVWGKV
ncbi:MAG: hypothetical protein HYR60_08055, partial [Acidobacteria bacterium]|nr:hypothetical protein [Acidobacteriota bacterium]